MFHPGSVRTAKHWRLFERFSGAFFATSFLASFAPGMARSDEQPRALPKDGSWVRYHVETEDVVEKKIEGLRSIELSFVGTVVEEGQTCRWLERKESVPDGEKGTKKEIIKVLVPEKDLWESDVPFEHFRRGWVLRPDGKIAEVTMKQHVLLHLNFAPLLLWTPGMLKDSKQVADQFKDIEYQAGRLKGAQARTGKLALPDNNYDISKYTAWQHPDLPIGCAEVRMTRELFMKGKKFNERLTVWRLQETGAEAKSSLPD